jgi:hypothetical protein
MTSWVDFYAHDRLGNRFAVTGPLYGRRGHRGVDWIHPAGAPIPSWTAGTVVVNAWSANLGWLIIIRTPLGLYAGYCHLARRSELHLQTAIDIGDIVGIVGNTGRLSRGAHLHATLEPTIEIGTSQALDPLPYILAALEASKPPTTERQDMAKNFTDRDSYKAGKPADGTRCLTLWEGGRVETYTRAPNKPGDAMAVSMSAAYGPHVEINAAVFDTLARPRMRA